MTLWSFRVSLSWTVADWLSFISFIWAGAQWGSAPSLLPSVGRDSVIRWVMKTELKRKRKGEMSADVAWEGVKCNSERDADIWLVVKEIREMEQKKIKSWSEWLYFHINHFPGDHRCDCGAGGLASLQRGCWQKHSMNAHSKQSVVQSPWWPHTKPQVPTHIYAHMHSIYYYYYFFSVLLSSLFICVYCSTITQFHHECILAADSLLYFVSRVLEVLLGLGGHLAHLVLR